MKGEFGERECDSSYIIESRLLPSHTHMHQSLLQNASQIRKFQNWSWFILRLSSSKLFFWFFSHWELFPLVIIAWSGAAIIEKESMNFCRYWFSQKLCTLVALVGVGHHLMMTSIFVGSTLSSPPPFTYPKYTRYYRENSQLLRFTSNLCSFSVSSTCMKYETCSSRDKDENIAQVHYYKQI